MFLLVYNIYDECGDDYRRRRLGDNKAGNKQKRSFQEVRQMMAAESVIVETEDSFSVSAGYSQVGCEYACVSGWVGM